MITDLHLINIRNYIDRTFELSPLTVIFGTNGRGKTNIIESLFFISTGKSFHASADREMIRFGQPFGRMQSGPVDITLINGERLQKQVRIHQKPARLLDILGVAPTVLFTPASLSLVDGSPSIRRQFIDILLSQSDVRYARSLLEYQRVLKHRNELLHQISNNTASLESLGLWDDMLVSSAMPVMMARKKMTELMASQINELYHVMSPHKADTVEILYVSSVEKRQTDQENELQLESLYRERLRERRQAEIHLSRTLIGPHRDDLSLLLRGKPAANYASRGEIRSVVVALKLFEYRYMSEQLGKEPTLLFDDIFSEFDPYRRKAMLEIMPEAQIIFTATDREHIGTVPKRAQIIDLDQEQS